mgnify:CR=1 FL=1
MVNGMLCFLVMVKCGDKLLSVLRKIQQGLFLFT